MPEESELNTKAAELATSMTLAYIAKRHEPAGAEQFAKFYETVFKSIKDSLK